ncbi:putative HERV-K-19q12 provirus ancestral Pol protein [Cricetulus griseus]|nr:putative HERV-K-19q12 provirus ancestral Pol protein [Cricetulus griseus]
MLTDLRAINKKDNEYWQIALTDFWGTISNNYPKTGKIKFIKKIVWILPHIVRQTPISGVLTFYTDANKSGKAGYKADEADTLSRETVRLGSHSG